MTSISKGGEGVLKYFTCLWIVYFLNNRSIVHFCGMGIGCASELVSFAGVINEWH